MTDKKQAALELLERRRLRSDLSPFVKKVFETIAPGEQYTHNWHIDLMCEYLSAVARGEIKRLLINIQPRILKSVTTSVAWPAWVMGQSASKKFLCASYAHKLSIKHNMDTRLIIDSSWYKLLFPETAIAYGENEKGKFTTTKRGMRMATSVGAADIGDGGDFLIVDDPVNPKESYSTALRDAANRWYDTSFITRLNDKKNGGIVIIMQRLHDNDLTGHVLDRDDWTHIKIPTIATERVFFDFGKVQFNREKGDLLFPEREPLEVVEQLQKSAGAFGFSAQYQQNPAPEGGGILKVDQWRYYDDDDKKKMVKDGWELRRRLQSWDTAFKTGQENDYSVCVSVEEYRNKTDEIRLLITDVFQDKLEFPELKRRVIDLHDSLRPQSILVEDKASGQSLIQELERIPVIGRKIVRVKGDTDKQAETHAAVPMIENGNVWLKAETSWLDGFLEETSKYPFGKHDDIVIATIQVINYAKESFIQMIW